jgi:hypothetical protein
MSGLKLMVGAGVGCLALGVLVPVVPLVSASPAAAAPTVSITAPVNGATESGVVEVDATATVDAGDSPVLITFSVLAGGNSSPSEFGQFDCIGGPQTCDGSAEWVAVVTRVRTS